MSLWITIQLQHQRWAAIKAGKAPSPFAKRKALNADPATMQHLFNAVASRYLLSCSYGPHGPAARVKPALFLALFLRYILRQAFVSRRTWLAGVWRCEARRQAC